MSKEKKPVVYAEILFTCGLILISFGITLMVHADLGISVASSVPFVISLRFTALTFGTWSYLVQGFLVILLIVIIRKIKWNYLLSFLVSVAFGVLVDVFSLLSSGLIGLAWPQRALLFAGGQLILTMGIALFVASRLPLLPYDLFVNELAIYKHISFRKCKTLFDLSCLLTSSLFLLLFVRRLAGIGIGSLISALLNGTLAGFWLGMLNRHITIRSIFQKQSRPAQ
ncbi:MAG: DUF6198 family protein [Bacillota bacterium]|nr:DUF6198 family protein [Bacillota bacterium]